MTLVKQVDLTAPYGDDGVRFMLKGSKRTGYRIEAVMFFETVAELVVSETDRRNLVALLTAAAPNGGSDER